MILYFTGLNYGLGDIIKGLSSLYHLSNTLNEDIYLNLLLPRNDKFILETFKEVLTILEPNEKIIVDLNLNQSIILDDDHPLVVHKIHNKGKKPELIYDNSDLFDIFKRTYPNVDFMRTKEICNSLNISPEQLFSFKYTPLPYWPCKFTCKRDSNLVSIQFNHRNKYKGLDDTNANIIINKLWELGYETINVGEFTNMQDVVDIMKECVFHVGIDSGISHVAHSMKMPCFIVTNNYNRGTTNHIKRASRLYHSLWAFYNHSYSLTNMYDIDSFLQINNIEDELIKMQQLTVFLYEHNVKYLQLIERMKIEHNMKDVYQDSAKFTNDFDIIQKFIDIRKVL